MVLVFTDLINNLLVQNYETTVKVFLLFGTFMFSLYYTNYVHPNLPPSDYFFVGTVRFLLFTTSKVWAWLFFLLTPVMLHPNVPIDNLLIFLASVYSFGLFIFTVIFITNAWFLVPEYVFDVMKLKMLDFPERHWLKKNYNRYINNKFK